MEYNEQLGQWLDLLWGDKPCKVYLAYKDDPSNPRSFSVPKAQSWPEKRDNIVQFLLAKSSLGKDTYYAPGRFRLDTVSKHKYVQENGKDTDIPNVESSRALFIDLDGNSAEALARLEAYPDLPRPTGRIQSGGPGHEHWYWILKAPRELSDFEPINKRLAYFFDADTGCWNADRVLRPPFTTNYKPEYGEPLPVDFIELNDNQYELEQFNSLPEVRDSIIENVHLGKLPTIEDIQVSYTWNKDFIELFRKNDPQDRSGALVRLGYYGAETGMPDEAIYVLIENADSRWGKFVGRSDRERRLAQIIQKVRVKHPYVPVEEEEDDDPIQLVYTFNELLKSEFKMDWLIDGVIPKGATCFVSAESGVGKSRLTLQIALAMASGTSFLSWPSSEKLKVFYLSLEMGGDELKEFISTLGGQKELSDDISNRFILSPIGSPLVLGSEEGFNLLETMCREHRPDVMFIDALGKLTLKKLEEEEAKKINNQLAKLKKKYGTTFIIIHHIRKATNSGGKGKQRPTQDDIYGDQYIITDAALVLTMWKEESKADIELFPLKVRFGKGPEPIHMDGTEFKFKIKPKRENVEGGEDGDTGFGLGLFNG